MSIVISYGSRTWSRTVYPFGSATPAGGPAPRHETPAQGAARLRAEVASGQLTLVGPARVDGQRAIELRQGTAARGLLRMWVSPDTYLPIRTVSTPARRPGLQPAGHQGRLHLAAEHGGEPPPADQGRGHPGRVPPGQPALSDCSQTETA